MSTHYLEGRYVEGVKKVAWVSSGAPVEPLRALGYFVVYPENHAALCGARKVAVEICEEAEKEGFSMDLCSYARTDIGSAISGKTPVGKIPKPDLLVVCTNICQTILYWFKALSFYFKVPLVIIDTPFIFDEMEEHQIDYVKRQIEEMMITAEKVAGKSVSFKKLRRVISLSKEAAELWLQIIYTGRAKPSPITAFDTFVHMAPIVGLRGEEITVIYYRKLLKEIEERIKKGIGAIKNEKKRILWDNLPVWFKLNWLSRYLASKGANIVTSTYTLQWGELAPMIDIDRPLESAAKIYLYPLLNRSARSKLETMKRMVKEFDIDGVLLHSDKSCKPYSLGQIDERNLLVQEGIPAVLIDADHNDMRSYSEEQVKNRLDAFLEII
jgi:benzoyl-CoA reductase/2-hydroxyglutaryl-CoA dehydratase subunit BcrC/BadD/HgdB